MAGSEAKVGDEESKKMERQNKAEETDNQINRLAIQLLADAQDNPNHGLGFSRPVDSFGYSNIPSLGMREGVFETQNALNDFFKEEKDDKGVKSLVLKGTYAGISDEIKKVEETYQALHQQQSEYFNGLLHGNTPAREKFKKEQAKKISDCNAALAKLRDRAAVESLPALDAIKAAVTDQQEKLKSLPNKAEPDFDNLRTQLQRQKQKNRGELVDKEINAEKYDKSKVLFSVYFSSTDDKAVRSSFDTNMSGSSIINISSKKPSVPSGASDGYLEAKQKVKAEMERIEKHPPHESWFSPFGVKNPNFIIHRYKKDGQWYLEPQWVDTWWRREKRGFTPSRSDMGFLGSKLRRVSKAMSNSQFEDALESMFAFQKFAECETDIVTLSFNGPVYSKAFINERVQKILDMVKLLEEKAEKDPSQAKALILDSHAKAALLASSKSTTRRYIIDTMAKLEKMAQAREAEMLKANKGPESVEKAIKTAQESLDKQGKVEEKEGSKKFNATSESVLQKSFAGEPPIAGRPLERQHNTLINMAAEIIAKKPAKEEKEKELTGIFEEEVNKVKQLYAELESAQEVTKTQMANVKTLLNDDPHNASLKGLQQKLYILQENQTLLYNELKERCDRWKDPDLYSAIEAKAEVKAPSPAVARGAGGSPPVSIDLAAVAPPAVGAVPVPGAPAAAGSKNDEANLLLGAQRENESSFNWFQKEIGAISTKVDSMKSTLDANTDELVGLGNSIVAEEKKAAEKFSPPRNP